MDCLFMTSFYVWLNLTRGSFSRFFGFDAEFGKGLFGFVAEPLELDCSIYPIFSTKRWFSLRSRSSLASERSVGYLIMFPGHQCPTKSNPFFRRQLHRGIVAFQCLGELCRILCVVVDERLHDIAQRMALAHFWSSDKGNEKNGILFPS